MKYNYLIVHEDLRARIFDIDWIYNRNYQSAIECANLYIKLAINYLNNEQWIYLPSRLERGISILLSLKKENIISDNLEKVKTAIRSLNGNDEFWLSSRLIQIY
ncbi:DUF7380 domain-containing protein, partial [Leptospira ognonensis]|uniref:DUF7380 domain-containing protein n=1 Tax=Leptospira ognonensis TaxID=2484945 RepID=UPI003CCC640F